MHRTASYNIVMRKPVIFVVLLLLAARCGAADDALATARRFANEGATQLALTQVERLQPAAPGSSGWDEWEQLRCSLMYRLGHYPALAQRAAQLPGNASE